MQGLEDKQAPAFIPRLPYGVGRGASRGRKLKHPWREPQSFPRETGERPLLGSLLVLDLYLG